MSGKVEQKKIQQKVYKGLFISNERKKNTGGRIKCQLFQNKIQVMGKNQSIHESEVQWVEVRRYKKENRFKKNNKRQDDKKKQEITKDKAAQISGKEINKPKQQVKISQPKQFVKLQEKEKSNSQASQKKHKKKYKLKQPTASKQQIDIIKQKNQSSIKDIQLKFMQQETAGQQYQKQDKKQKLQKEIKDNIEQVKQNEEKKQQMRQIKQEDEKDRQNQSQSDNEGENKQKDLQIIVAKIKTQINIPFKTKPFVGILYFQKKNKQYKSKDIVEKQSPIQQILNDFYADIQPIHPRLPVMELDDYIIENYQIIMDYINNNLKFDEKAKRKSQLNRIIEEISNVYILVTFTEWNGDRPLAKLHKILGKAMTIEGECQRFLYEHGLNGYEYKQQEQKIIEINPTQYHKKVEKMVFTIDPPTSTDLDDALSIEKLSEDNFLVGIHIADVTSYLHLIDRQQISRRTTSVYLPYKVYHMLSRNLVKVCSLDPGVERLAFTILVNFDSKGNIVGQSRIEKSIVKSRYKLSYEMVQNILTESIDYKQFNKKYPSSSQQYDLLVQSLLDLHEIATAHRSKRVIFDVFQNQQMQFTKDQSGWPIQCFIEKRFTSKKMVQQFMIIGNIQSAKIICKSHAQSALVIHHPKPSKLSVSFFNQSFKQFQIKLKFQNSLQTQKNLLELQQNPKIKSQIKQICYFKARRSMQAANYKIYQQIIDELVKQAEKKKQKQSQKISHSESQNYPIIHFALGLQFYTHFTSPMRRMADIIVHETLNKIIEGKKDIKLDISQIEKINNGRKYTKRLKKDLNEIYLCLMIYHTKKPLECQGIISSFGLMSVSIYIPMFDMQRQVLWKRQLSVNRVNRIKNQQNKLDIKLYHDKNTSKKDVWWIIERFQTVKVKLDCTKYAPLKLTMQITVQSQKGPYLIKWVDQ